jgi:hypothetical protein
LTVSHILTLSAFGIRLEARSAPAGSGQKMLRHTDGKCRD